MDRVLGVYAFWNDDQVADLQTDQIHDDAVGDPEYVVVNCGRANRTIDETELTAALGRPIGAHIIQAWMTVTEAQWATLLRSEQPSYFDLFLPVGWTDNLGTTIISSVDARELRSILEAAGICLNAMPATRLHRELNELTTA